MCSSSYRRAITGRKSASEDLADAGRLVGPRRDADRFGRGAPLDVVADGAETEGFTPTRGSSKHRSANGTTAFSWLAGTRRRRRSDPPDRRREGGRLPRPDAGTGLAGLPGAEEWIERLAARGWRQQIARSLPGSTSTQCSTCSPGMAGSRRSSRPRTFVEGSPTRKYFLRRLNGCAPIRRRASSSRMGPPGAPESGGLHRGAARLRDGALGGGSRHRSSRATA